MKKLVLTCLLAACAAASARAVVICTAPTATTAGSLQITAPVSFTINAGGNAQAFVLSNWVTSDGSQTAGGLAPNVSFTLNGAAGLTAGSLYDNLASTIGSVGANDGYIFLNSSFTVTSGNTVTLSAGTYAIPAVGNYNPQTTQTFTGNMFITDNGGVRLSPNVSVVPEPGTWALLAAGAGGLGVVALRRRVYAA